MSTFPRPLRVLMFAIGSSGDVHPFIAVGQRLRERGHAVLLTANSQFEQAIRGAGLEFRSNGSVEEYRRATSDPDLWRMGRGFRVLVAEMLRSMRDAYHLIEERRVEGETVVVAPGSALGARVARDKLGVPLVNLHVQPLILRSLYYQPGFEVPSLIRPLLPRLRKAMLAALDWRVFDPAIGPELNAFRAELGLPPVNRILDDWIHSPDRVIGLFPEWFAPPLPDWPPQLRLTGFPLYDEADARPMPPELERFLDSGPPPLVFTAGTAMGAAAQFLATSVEVCRRLNRRGVLLTGFTDQAPKTLPETVQVFDYAPFSELLPRAAALVHHGGIGSLAQALRAGIPQLVTPMNFDQPDNALRLRRLGVGAVLKRHRYRARAAVRELERLLSSRDVAARCRALAAKFPDQNWLEQTCELVEEAVAERLGQPWRVAAASG